MGERTVRSVAIAGRSRSRADHTATRSTVLRAVLPRQIVADGLTHTPTRGQARAGVAHWGQPRCWRRETAEATAYTASDP